MLINAQHIEFASNMADIASEMAAWAFRRHSMISIKTNQSPVTEADLRIEEALRAAIEERFPSHGIWGEEYGMINGNSEYVWVIDPIDGTSSFACGKPSFCTLIALLYQGRPVLGLIDQPITQDRWIGVLGQRSRWNAQPCSIRTEHSTEVIKLSCTTPAMFRHSFEQAVFAKVCAHASVVSYGGDAYSYGLLAAGHIDIILEADLQYHDVAALIPVIEGAGGLITDWQGNAINSKTFEGRILASGSSTLHQTILGII